MPIGRAIVEVFEAIPERIEVSGHEPTWQVTGGSFESTVSFANEAFDDPVVVARQDRSRWWPRVTLTVTKDPELAAGAPPLETLAHPVPPPEPDAPVQQVAEPVADQPIRVAEPITEPVVIEPVAEPVVIEQPVAEPVVDDLPMSALEEMFAHQEAQQQAQRQARRGIPRQWRRR